MKQYKIGKFNTHEVRNKLCEGNCIFFECKKEIEKYIGFRRVGTPRPHPLFKNYT